MEYDSWAGFGKDGKPEFWFGVGQVTQMPMHIAFVAKDHDAVDAFYRAALSTCP